MDAISINDGLYPEDEEFIKKQMLEDLQLAAELGNTLLERNKELEKLLRQQQTVIDDQTQEIEYLNKQTAALREVNDSRLRIYENLETSIQDLERTNHQLNVDKQNDKKQIKKLHTNVHQLESQVFELQQKLEDISRENELFKRKIEQSEDTTDYKSKLRDGEESALSLSTDSIENRNKIEDINPSERYGFTTCQSTDQNKTQENLLQKIDKSNNYVTYSEYSSLTSTNSVNDEDITQLIEELRDERIFRSRDQRRVIELEEQLASLVQENQSLRQKISSLNQNNEMKSMHEEITTLEEVRDGYLCSRCLRKMERQTEEELTMYLDQEEFEDDGIKSMNSSLNTDTPGSTTIHTATASIDVANYDKNTSNGIIEEPATEKEQAYKEIEKKYEELYMLQMTHVPKSKRKRHKKSKNKTNLSESKTEDSKEEKVEEKVEESKINDLTSPIDERFRSYPQYRKTFTDILANLNSSANDETSKEWMDKKDIRPLNLNYSHLLNDESMSSDWTDDNQSVLSYATSEASSIMDQERFDQEMELRREFENMLINGQEKDEKKNDEINKENIEKNKEPILVPYKRDQLEYLSVQVRSKKSKKKKYDWRNTESPVLPSVLRINYSSRLKDYRPNQVPSRARDNNTSKAQNNDGSPEWNGNSMQFYSKKSPNVSSQNFKPSTASEDLHKLIKLDYTYAEVLRSQPKKYNKRRTK